MIKHGMKTLFLCLNIVKGQNGIIVLITPNALFALIDTIGVNHVIAYVQRLQQPSSDF